MVLENGEKYKILLVEDNHHLRIVIRDYLMLNGFDVVLASDGQEGTECLNRENFDLVILDIMMPRKDGFTIASEMRSEKNETPVIFLTAKALNEDRIKGLQLGADDYITKPFSSEELLLRIKAILKRTGNIRSVQNQAPQSMFKIGQYIFDFDNLVLIHSGSSKTTLTRKEASLLCLLCQNRNLLVSRETLIKHVWGRENDYYVGRSMDVFITKLRKYLSKDPGISLNNVHGTGFRLEITEDNL